MIQDTIYEASAETAILSCLCHGSRELQKEMVEKLNETHFYLQENKIIYQAALRQIGKGIQADWINVRGELQHSNQFDLVGGDTKMREVATFCHAGQNWQRYFPKLEDARYRRSLEVLASEIVKKSRDREMPVEQLKNWSETAVMRCDYLTDSDEKLSIKEPTIAAISNIEAILQGNPNRGISTGLEPLDRMIPFGLRGGDMVVIAARPSVGKSASAMQIVEHVALDLKKRVLVFSLEMSSQSLMERMIRSRAKVPVAQMLLKQISSRQSQSLADAAQAIVGSQILCDDNVGKSIGYIKSVARHSHQKKPLDLIVIDYLQLVHGSSKRSKENRTCEVEEVSNGVKELAKSLKIPVIVLAQLNRDPEKRKLGKPVMSDLKGSGSIEQDSDILVLLHRKDLDDDEPSPMPEVDFIVAKQREGETGTCKMIFNKAITRFEVPVPY
jgi:replicative DNA helicase